MRPSLAQVDSEDSGEFSSPFQVPLDLDAASRGDRAPETFPVVVWRQSPGEIGSEEPQGVGSRSARNIREAEVQAREILDSPMLGKRMNQADADQVDHTQVGSLRSGVADEEDVRRFQVAVRERAFVERSEELCES